MSLEARVWNILIEDVYKVDPEIKVRDAAEIMLEKNVGCLLVSGTKGPIGIVTERDVLRRVTAAGLNPNHVLVKDIMSFPLIGVSPETSLGDAAKKMIDNGIKRLAVQADDGKFVGLVTMTDFLKWMAKQEALSDSLINYLNYGVP
jgi:CBS domain-containing protein